MQHLSKAVTASITLLHLQMLQAGFKPGAGNIEVESMDRRIIEGNSVLDFKACFRCKGKLLYYAFHKRKVHRVYIPYTICSQCGNTREF